MNSLDAQCLVCDLACANDAQAPDQWQHLSDGTLAYRFGDSAKTFSWPADAVAEMATRWRAAGRAVPAPVARLVERHLAFAQILQAGDLEEPARIIHDLRTAEVTAVWDDEEVLVVTEPD